jgi:hypothetical protein
MKDWPSLNQVTLIGKVARCQRIQWSDGSATAWFRLVTRKVVATPKGFQPGYDFHEVEVSPADRFFSKAWEGAVVMVRGEYESHAWTPRGATTSFDRHTLAARAFQLILPSDKPQVPIPTLFRAHRQEIEPTTRGHSHERTESPEG